MRLFILLVTALISTACSASADYGLTPLGKEVSVIIETWKTNNGDFVPAVHLGDITIIINKKMGGTIHHESVFLFFNEKYLCLPNSFAVLSAFSMLTNESSGYLKSCTEVIIENQAYAVIDLIKETIYFNQQTVFLPKHGIKLDFKSSSTVILGNENNLFFEFSREQLTPSIQKCREEAKCTRSQRIEAIQNAIQEKEPQFRATAEYVKTHGNTVAVPSPIEMREKREAVAKKVREDRDNYAKMQGTKNAIEDSTLESKQSNPQSD